MLVLCIPFKAETAANLVLDKQKTISNHHYFEFFHIISSKLFLAISFIGLTSKWGEMLGKHEISFTSLYNCDYFSF